STAVVMLPLDSSMRRPISLTSIGPLCSSASRMVKSEKPRSCAAMLRCAWRAIVRCAFISTRYRCVPELSAIVTSSFPRVRRQPASRAFQSCARAFKAATDHSLAVGLGDLADELCPGHVDGLVDLAGLRSRIVLEDFHHQGRVVRDDDACLQHA